MVLVYDVGGRRRGQAVAVVLTAKCTPVAWANHARNASDMCLNHVQVHLSATQTYLSLSTQKCILRVYLTVNDAWSCVRNAAVVGRSRDLPLATVVAELAAPFTSAPRTT